MSEPDVFTLSSDHKIHAAALAGHVDRQRAASFQNIRENLMTEKLGITSNATMFKTVSMDDPKITLPSGKRTDELSLEELRQEMKKLPIPGVIETSGKMELIRQLKDYVASITRVCWPEQKEGN